MSQSQDEIRRKILEILSDNSKKPPILKKIYKTLQAHTKEQRKEIRKLLSGLLEEGVVYRDGRGRYKKTEQNTALGIIEFARRGSVAFVTTDDEREIAVPLENTKGALHKDKVLVEIVGKWRDLPKGRVIKVLQRGTRFVVGVFDLKRNFGFLTPDDPKITYDFFIPPDATNGARPGQKVIARITRWPTATKNPQAEIVEILGKADDPKVDLPSVIIKHNLPEEFPEDVLKQVEALPNLVKESEIAKRRNLTQNVVFTIDGEDAKDFDDAVSIQRLKDGRYVLGVHIADVSHYVEENSPLDREAYKRGTSVYLLDKVIPMLPFKLSNDLCSLVEGKPRLTFSVEMMLNDKGEVLDYQLNESVIESKKRLTYSEVNRFLQGDSEVENRLGKEICHSLKTMFKLSKILRQARRIRGSILDIEGGEVDIITDEDGHVVDITTRQRGPAEILIEEFMIKANETVAEVFHNAGLPFVYRIHEKPDSETIFLLKNYLEALGIRASFPKVIHPSVLQKLLEAVRDHPLKSSVERLLVRTMKRAIYSVMNVGHFGLASYAYTHFTSPIRRYPDLVVHRLLKLYLSQGGYFTSDQIEKYSQVLPKVAAHCSKRERIADEAEWDLIAMKKVEYISNHFDDVFDAVVTNVTGFGLFVEIPSKLISGLVHISTLNDYYRYDDRLNILVGERSSRVFRIGDLLKVRAIKADKRTGEIDFEIVSRKDKSSKARKK